MEVTLEEDKTPKQYIFMKERNLVQEGDYLAELRILSDNHNYISQIHPENFDSFRRFLENELHGEQHPVPLDIDSSSVDDECAYCGARDVSTQFRMPVTLNLSKDGIYPALSGGQYSAGVCRSCAEEIYDSLMEILESRKDILLAHEI